MGNRTGIAREDIEKAAAIIRDGGVVVLPTDTIYGIACDHQNEKAIQRVMDIKERTDNKLVLIASSINQVEKFFPLTPRQRKIAKRFWPGPLSIVVSDRFSIRVPDNAVTRSIVENVRRPIVATSANKSGQDPQLDLDGIKQELGVDAVDMWIAGGTSEGGEPSTVINVTDTDVEIIRKGVVPKKEIERAL